MTPKIRNKINSMTLESGVTVNYKSHGEIELVEISDTGIIMGKVSIRTTDLEAIRDTAKLNGRIEAGNGIETVNEKKA